MFSGKGENQDLLQKLPIKKTLLLSRGEATGTMGLSALENA
jgi:hypothetical protein